MSSDAGSASRRVAIAALVRIDEDDAYANLALPAVLRGSGLAERRDRNLVTELVYGTTRRRRACDWLVDRFVDRPLDPPVRAALRVGAYQLAFTDIPAHAAVGATVGAVPRRVSGLVNAVLRRVAEADPEWPDEATRLSYPDWIVERLVEDLGREAAVAALEEMNRPATATTRDDGYVQDLASQWVVDLVGGGPGDRVLDLCAAPGGKATGIARTGATVVAGDIRPSRVRLVAQNVAGTGATTVHALVADATRAPVRPSSADSVLVDAPCSGLGVLRRRADARWRIRPDDVAELAGLQRRIVEEAARLVRPGGTLVYSVCTLTAAETLGVDAHLEGFIPDWAPQEAPHGPWIPWGRGALLLPQAAGTDGMMVLRLRRPPQEPR